MPLKLRSVAEATVAGASLVKGMGGDFQVQTVNIISMLDAFCQDERASEFFSSSPLFTRSPLKILPLADWSLLLQ